MRNKACTTARHGSKQKVRSKATILELYNRRVEQHAQGRNVRKEVAREVGHPEHHHAALEDNHLEAVLTVAEMLETLCWTAPAIMGASSLST